MLLVDDWTCTVMAWNYCSFTTANFLSGLCRSAILIFDSARLRCHLCC